MDISYTQSQLQAFNMHWMTALAVRELRELHAASRTPVYLTATSHEVVRVDEPMTLPTEPSAEGSRLDPRPAVVPTPASSGKPPRKRTREMAPGEPIPRKSVTFASLVQSLQAQALRGQASSPALAQKSQAIEGLADRLPPDITADTLRAVLLELLPWSRRDEDADPGPGSGSGHGSGPPGFEHP